MIDLCIDARMAFSSGIGTYIRELIPYLKCSFRLILLVDGYQCEGVELIEMKAPIYSVKEQLLFPLKIPNCDLFWSPHYNVPLLPVRAKKRVSTIHDVCHLIYGSGIEKSYARFVIGRALKSDRVITVSQFSRDEIEREFGRKRIDIVHIGVNTSHFYRRPFSERVRKKYQLPEKFALFIGSKKRHKNLQGFLKAKTDLELVAVGRGLLEFDWEDLPYLYSMAEVFVFPSFYEGFGLPPLEAMACGCPTAVSNAASIPEVCANASVYFNPNDVEEMKFAINAAREKKLVQEGLKRVELFQWKIAAEKHIQIFEEAFNA